MDGKSTVLTVVVGALCAGLGWLISQLFTLAHDVATREATTRMKFLERQIEEFYGPLFSLSNQIQDAWAVRDWLIRASIAAMKKGIDWDPERMGWKVSEEDRQNWPLPNEDVKEVSDADIAKYRNRLPISTIRFYALEDFIYPLYAQATKVLAEKLHLLGDSDVPASYREFMHHALQNRFQNQLYIVKKVPTMFTAAPPYPDKFRTDVEQGLEKLLLEYARLQGQVAEAARWRSVRGRIFEAMGLSKPNI